MNDQSNKLNFLLIPNRLQYFLISTLILFLSIFFYYFENLKYLSLSLLFLNLLSLIKFRKSIPLFILFFYITLFTQPLINFSFFSRQISFWTDFQNTKILLQVCLVQFLFLFAFFNVIKVNINFNLIKNSFAKNVLLTYLLLLICLLILIFGLRGENIFQSGSYANNENVEKSSIHEYFIIFFLLFRIFMPVNKFTKCVYYILFFAYVFKTLLFGGRIEVVEISLVVLFIDIIPKYKISVSKLIIILFLLFYVNLIISNIRSNPLSLLNGEYIELLYPFNSNNNFESSTQGDVIQSSGRLIGILNTNSTDYFYRTSSFLNYLSSPFFISSLFNSTSNLAKYKQDTFQSGGGGLISIYFYFWLSYLGPIFIGIILAIFINFSTYNIYFLLYSFTLFITFPRWVAYNPIFLLKFCLFTILFFFICKLFFHHRIIKQ